MVRGFEPMMMRNGPVGCDRYMKKYNRHGRKLRLTSIHMLLHTWIQELRPKL